MPVADAVDLSIVYTRDGIRTTGFRAINAGKKMTNFFITAVQVLQIRITIGNENGGKFPSGETSLLKEFTKMQFNNSAFSTSSETLSEPLLSMGK